MNKSVKKAMQHPNVLGAGAKKRKHLSKENKASAVMSEFRRGTLHSGSGKVVTSPAQAKAIMLSEMGVPKRYKK